jgi:Mn2+/Fe2+ NRAMP family transporter
MCIMMLMASNRKIMGELTLPIYLKVLGWADFDYGFSAAGMLSATETANDT